MGEKDHLHALIHSMKKNEQSYFKKIKSAFGIVNSSLLQIFNVIHSQKEYNEEAILSKLDKDSFREFYSVKKHALYHDILDVLAYNKSHSNDAVWQINRTISHAIVLKEKMLYDEAFRLLQKIKKLAHENELFSKLSEINQHLIEILNQNNSMTDFIFSETAESLRMDTIQANEKSINAEQYFILSDQLYRKGETLRLTSNERVKKEMHQLYLSPLLNNEKKALSKTALVCYHFILYFKYANYEINYSKALYHLKELITLQENIKRFSDRARVTQMGNFVIMALKDKQMQEAHDMVKKIQTLFESNKDDYVLSSYLAHKGLYVFITNNTTEIKDFVYSVEELYRETLDKTTFSKEIMDIKHLLFCYYFKNGNYKKAYQIASFLDAQFDLHSFKNMKLSEKILKLLCVYEMNECDLIQSEIRAIKYLIKSVHDQLEMELRVFDMLERLIKANNEQAKGIILNQYLENNPENQTPDKYSFLIDGFNFNHWVKSKVLNEEHIPTML